MAIKRPQLQVMILPKGLPVQWGMLHGHPTWQAHRQEDGGHAGGWRKTSYLTRNIVAKRARYVDDRRDVPRWFVRDRFTTSVFLDDVHQWFMFKNEDYNRMVEGQ